MSTIIEIELKNIFRNIAFRIGFLVVFLFGIYGIYYGDSVIRHQRENIARIESLENENIEHILHIAKENHTAGTQLYYMMFHTYNPPSDWAAFALGQRDVLNYNIKTKLLALEGQIYDTELTNPLSLLVGNLDLSFVFIYLLPLLIIALGFNLISEEKEIGIWSMIKTSGVSILYFITIKILIRWGLVTVLALILLIIAGVVFKAGLGIAFWSILAVTISYISFWFALVWIINAMNKSSNFNATIMVVFWIVLCFIFPALGNTVINTTIPISEAMETTLIQREAYHEKWDMPKSVTMSKFYEEYSEYRKYKIPEEEYYVAGWYFAMQYVADKEAEPLSKQMEMKLLERQEKAKILGLFVPTIGVQRVYNEVAHTDLAKHLGYLESVRKYHKAMREYFYPYIFEETLTKDVPWDKRPKYIPAIQDENIDWKNIYISIFTTGVFVLVGIRRMTTI